MNYPSKLIENAVAEISKLPGIGKKSALRLVLHLLKRDLDFSQQLSKAIVNLRENILYCKTCFNVADSDTCEICASSKRDGSVICVVEDLPDVLAIENTGQYFGLYHVLGGIIAPLEGIGPNDLKIKELIDRCIEANNPIKEIILGLSPTMEGDTTAYYLTQKLKNTGVKVSTIAKGIPIGGDLEYADEITLGRSILNRIRME